MSKQPFDFDEALKDLQSGKIVRIAPPRFHEGGSSCSIMKKFPCADTGITGLRHCKTRPRVFLTVAYA
jgi:hypothetical protein